MYDVKWDEKAIEKLGKLEPYVSQRIIKKVKELSLDPFLKDIKRLGGSNGFRLRVGDYRVIFSINENIIEILKVGHRKNIYDRIN